MKKAAVKSAAVHAPGCLYRSSALRGCFHVDNVNAFYQVRPEAELQKEMVRKSQEALFDNFAGTHVDTLLAMYEEEDE